MTNRPSQAILSNHLAAGELTSVRDSIAAIELQVHLISILVRVSCVPETELNKLPAQGGLGRSTGWLSRTVPRLNRAGIDIGPDIREIVRQTVRISSTSLDGAQGGLSTKEARNFLSHGGSMGTSPDIGLSAYQVALRANDLLHQLETLIEINQEPSGKWTIRVQDEVRDLWPFYQDSNDGYCEVIASFLKTNTGNYRYNSLSGGTADANKPAKAIEEVLQNHVGIYTGNREVEDFVDQIDLDLRAFSESENIDIMVDGGLIEAKWSFAAQHGDVARCDSFRIARGNERQWNRQGSWIP